jgi:hypothetical protein
LKTTDALTSSINLSAGAAAVILSIVVIIAIITITGFIFGTVAAIIYNLVAGIFGGIRIDLA